MKHITVRIILFCSLVAAGLLAAALVAQLYGSLKQQEIVRRFADFFVRENQSETDASPDTYGGTAPRETLTQLIAALRAHDDLAAGNFFIEARRAAARERFAVFSESDRAALIARLEAALGEEGTYSFRKDAFTIRNPILIDFVRYPNGIWKIVEPNIGEPGAASGGAPQP